MKSLAHGAGALCATPDLDQGGNGESPAGLPAIPMSRGTVADVVAAPDHNGTGRLGLNGCRPMIELNRQSLQRHGVGSFRLRIEADKQRHCSAFCRKYTAVAIALQAGAWPRPSIIHAQATHHRSCHPYTPTQEIRLFNLEHGSWN